MTITLKIVDLFEALAKNLSSANPSFVLLFSILLSACAATPEPLSETDINAFLNRYEQQTRELQARREAERERGIHSLEITDTSKELRQQVVTASLEYAYVSKVIEQLGINYTLDGMSGLPGRVTTRFERLPMADALDAILTPVQLQAIFANDLVIISRIPELALAMESDDDYIFHKRILRFADTRALEPILPSLLGEEDNSDDDDDDDYDTSMDDENDSSNSSDSGNSSSSPTKTLTFAPLHSENAIVLKGPSGQVRNALGILDAIDTDTGHIMIEATVLQFSANDLLQIGTRISGGASGNFSDISIDWASLIGETISFTSVSGAANTSAFRAAISLLLQNDQARIMARPYMAAIPGNQAKIDVAEDRYVTTFTQNAGEVTLEPVTSGVTMTMTPFLLPEEQIRMDLEVSVSQFVPTLDNIALARSRSDASSTMRIASGETLVIGGLMAEQSAKSIAGVPGARSTPGLGFLFGERKSTDVERRVIIYITPYIWEPGMDTPLDSEADVREFMEKQTLFKSNEKQL